MAKVTLTDVGSTLTNSAAATINENSDRIAAAIEKTLSRDGTAPNNMEADLDMDSNDILNVDNVHANVLVLGGQVVTPGDISVLPPTVMTKPVYDPQNIEGDVFLRTNFTGEDGRADFSTQALFAAATIPVVIQSVAVHGYWSAGDGGAHIKKRVAAPSTVEIWHSQSADGAWWEVSEAVIKPQMFGAKGDNVNDDTAAIQGAIDYGKEVYLPKGDYKVTKTLLITQTAQIIRGAGMGYGYGRPNFTFVDFEPVTRIIGTGTFSTRVMTRRKHRASAVDPKDDAMSTVIDVEADGVSISDLTIWLNANYSNTSPGNYGDEISMGLFVGCRPGFKLRDVGVFGHFRKAGIYIDVTRSLELPELTDLDGNTLPEGSSGASFAGGDGTVLINPFVYGPLGPSLAILGAINTGANYYDEATGLIPDTRGASGCSDFEVFAGRFYGAQHQSGRRTADPTGYGVALTRVNMEAESDFFPASLYIDGWAANSGSTTHGIGALRNMNFYSTRFTSCEAFRVRLGTCDQIKFLGTAWAEAGDFPSGQASWRDTAGTDINPNDYTLKTYGHFATHSTKTGRVTLQDAVGGINQTWVANFNRTNIIDAFGVSMVGGLIINKDTANTASEIGGAFRTASLGDDIATSWPMPGANFCGVVAISTSNGADATAPRGLFFVRQGVAPVALSMISVANITFTTGALANGAGVDGNVTISTHTDGRLYISNRSGAARTIAVQFLAPT